MNEVENSLARLEEQVKSLRLSFESYCVQHEKLQRERAEVLKDQLQKSEKTLNIRLEQMNDFRMQINLERATYVTKKELDLRIRPLEKVIWGLAAILALLAAIGIPVIIFVQ